MMKKSLSFMLALVFALMILPMNALADSFNVVLDGVGVPFGKYLHVGANTVSDSAPADAGTGYAHLSSDGKTLTLHNYSNSKLYLEYVLEIHNSVTLKLEGQNKLISNDFIGNAIYMAETSAVIDMTITGDGTLTMDALSGIYSDVMYGDIPNRNLTINGGTLKMGSNKETGIICNKLTINGGDLQFDVEYSPILCDNITINGGNVKTNSKYSSAIMAGEKMDIKGGKVYATSASAAIVGYDSVSITGGYVEATSSSFESPILSNNNPIKCTLSMADNETNTLITTFENEHYVIDEIEILQAMAALSDEALEEFSKQRTVILPYGNPAPAPAPAAPAAPNVPATGDNSAVALWAVLMLLSGAAVVIMGRKAFAK